MALKCEGSDTGTLDVPPRSHTVFPVSEKVNALTPHSMAGVHSEQRVIRWFCHCANVAECTYTSLDGTAYSALWCSLLHCRRGKKSSLLGSWLRHPYNERQVDKRNTSKSSITCLSPVYMGETQENWVKLFKMAEATGWMTISDEKQRW